MGCGEVTWRLLSLVSPTVGFQEEFMELLFRFHDTLRRLQLQEPEYVLMVAMALFSPGEHFLKPTTTAHAQLLEYNHPKSSSIQTSQRVYTSLGLWWAMQAQPCPPPCPSQLPVLQTGLELPRERRLINCRRRWH